MTATGTATQLARLDEAQKRRFHDDGFLLLRGVLRGDELARTLEMVERIEERERAARALAADAPLEVRNAVARHPEVVRLIDHPAAFPVIADLMGPELSLHTCHVLVRPPSPAGTADSFKAINWHRDGHGSVPAVHGRYPWLYSKIGYFLTDLSRPGMGNLRVVPGSHLRAEEPRRSAPEQIDPDDAIEVCCEPGDAVIFQQALWHAVGPNRAAHARKNVYVGYAQRWLRPIDCLPMPADLVARSSPIRRQLLGHWESECSFWLPKAEELPLKAWLKAYRDGEEPALG